METPTKPFAFNVLSTAKETTAFRHVLFTTPYSQHTMMAVSDLIPREKHDYNDQTIVVLDGVAKVIVNDTAEYTLNAFETIVVPANTYHEVRNASDKPVKIYTIYTPPLHPPGEYQETRPLSD